METYANSGHRSKERVPLINFQSGGLAGDGIVDSG